jgi:hypothetical protein
MKRLTSHAIGVDQGNIVLFSDFEDNGEMWSGNGPRLNRTAVSFSEKFTDPPAVMVALSMFDVANSANARMDLQAENITVSGFDLVFRTWEETQVARVRATWQAIGELPNEDTWDI